MKSRMQERPSTQMERIMRRIEAERARRRLRLKLVIIAVVLGSVGVGLGLAAYLQDGRIGQGVGLVMVSLAITVAGVAAVALRAEKDFRP